MGWMLVSRNTPPLRIAQDLCDESHNLGAGFADCETTTESSDMFLRYREFALSRGRAIRKYFSKLPYNGYEHFADLRSKHEQGKIFPARNLFWGVWNQISQPRYLVSSHLDYVAGEGAVDNASGMAVMAAVAARLVDVRNILFVCFDLEEEGRLGSKKFYHDFRTRLQNLRHMINIDSIGKGTLVRYQPPNTVSHIVAGLPNVLLQNHANDTYSFRSLHERCCLTSLMTLDMNGEELPAGGLRTINFGEALGMNVANQVSDTRDQLCEDTLNMTVDTVERIIREDMQEVMRGVSKRR